MNKTRGNIVSAPRQQPDSHSARSNGETAARLRLDGSAKAMGESGAVPSGSDSSAQLRRYADEPMTSHMVSSAGLASGTDESRTRDEGNISTGLNFAGAAWVERLVSRIKSTSEACLRTSKQLASALPRSVGVAMLLVVVALCAEVVFSVSPKESTEVIYGGPAMAASDEASVFDQAIAYASTGVFDEGIDATAVQSPLPTIRDGAVAGGTLFNASTLLNPAGRPVYLVAPGDTTFTVAKAHDVDEKELIKLNHLADGPLIVGDTLLLPGVAGQSTAVAATVQFNGYLPKGFIWPAPGPIGPKHDRYDAHDIPDPKGTPVVASGDGIVLRAPYGWGGGYGNYVLLEHPGLVMPSGFVVETLYGHLSEILVVPGQKVKKGEVIGLMGSTGISTGPHVHFEVRTW